MRGTTCQTFGNAMLSQCSLSARFRNHNSCEVLPWDFYLPSYSTKCCCLRWCNKFCSRRLLAKVTKLPKITYIFRFKTQSFIVLSQAAKLFKSKTTLRSKEIKVRLDEISKQRSIKITEQECGVQQECSYTCKKKKGQKHTHTHTSCKLLSYTSSCPQRDGYLFPAKHALGCATVLIR